MSSSQLVLDTDILSLLMRKNSSVLASAKEYAATVERKLKSFDAKVVGESNLKSSLDHLTKAIDVSAIYLNSRTKIEEILTNKKYDEAIRIYNNKGLAKQISSIFGFKSNELIEFIQRLVSSKEGEPLISIMQGKVPQITA